MATRILRDGTEAVASTLYISKGKDSEFKAVARKRTERERHVISKARVMTEILEKSKCT